MGRNYDEHREVDHADFDDLHRFDDTRHDVVVDQEPERPSRPARIGEARDEAAATAALYGSTRRTGNVTAFPVRRPPSLDHFDDDLGGTAA